MNRQDVESGILWVAIRDSYNLTFITFRLYGLCLLEKQSLKYQLGRPYITKNLKTVNTVK